MHSFATSCVFSCVAIALGLASASRAPHARHGHLQQGDQVPSTDFRSVYSTLLEDWLGMDAKPIVGGTFEKPAFIETN